MRSKLKFHERYLLPITTVTLAAIGMVMIYSASSYSAEINLNDPFFYVKKQAVAFAAGLILMVVAGRIKQEWLHKARIPILIASMVLLGLVFVPGLGVESYGATRWLNLGFTTIQPSELSKFGLMIFLASYMSEYPPVKLGNMIIPVLCSLIIAGLIMAEPNMSITVCVAGAVLILTFVAGLPKKYFIPVAAVLAIAVPVLIIMEPYRVKRLLAFLDPWQNPKGEGYQLIQSYYALGNGGLFGVGLFASRQKYLFLPFAESDFIFSVIAEETGVVGCVFVIAIFALYIFVGIRTAMNAKNRFYSLLCAGIISVTALQVIINMAVVTGSIPPTGVPLPLISAGGTGLMTYMFVSGLVYNVARVTNGEIKP